IGAQALLWRALCIQKPAPTIAHVGAVLFCRLILQLWKNKKRSRFTKECGSLPLSSLLSCMLLVQAVIATHKRRLAQLALRPHRHKEKRLEFRRGNCFKSTRTIRSSQIRSTKITWYRYRGSLTQ